MLKRIHMIKRCLFVLFIISFLIGCSGEKPPDKNLSGTTQVVSNSEKQENIPILLKRPEPLGNAPDFTTVRVGGGEFKLSSLKDKVVILNFWSVDCPVCKRQIPVLVELYKEYNKDGLEVVGVSLDRESIVKSYAKLMHMDYILILANEEIVSKYRKDIRFIPTTFVIDRQGNIAQKHIGYTTKSVFEKEIKKLINSKEK